MSNFSLFYCRFSLFRPVALLINRSLLPICYSVCCTPYLQFWLREMQFLAVPKKGIWSSAANDEEMIPTAHPPAVCDPC